MRATKKLALAGVAVSVLSVGMIVPTTNALSAPTARPSLAQLLDEKKMIGLMTQSNGAVNVDTELNCADHTLVAHVTNKTDANIMPNVTFNDQQPSFPPDGNLPIEPGKTRNYFWSYSGNNLLANVKVHVDSQADLALAPTLYCSEPVSFRVDQTSDSAVVGTLTNNSTFVAQTAYARVNNGDVRVEALAPGESRVIALPFTPPMPDPQSAFVAIGTDGGYEGTYNVDLKQQIVQPLRDIK